MSLSTARIGHIEHLFGRGERSETAAADLGAMAILPLDITLRGAGCGL
jgi:hypothetical protein